MKKLIVTLSLITGALVAPKLALAEEQICTTTYGQGVVCGVKTPPTEIKTGLVDDFRLIGAGLIGASALFYLHSKSRAKSA